MSAKAAPAELSSTGSSRPQPTPMRSPSSFGSPEVGNALTDDFLDHYGVFEYYWMAGLISDRSYRMLNLHRTSLSFLHKSPECDDILDSALEEIGDIDIYSIFSPTCTCAVTFSGNKLLKRLHDSGKMGDKYDPCIENYSTVYFNSPEVQKALHVNPAFAPPKWITCSNVINENWHDTPSSVLNIYHELIQHGLRIWMVR
ncbi:serine carboxypeptidase II-2-like [Ananas comosus]|uniref:Serine carboxypeptidase II-2-like n=1 Tax=Ananas comosus TaxID=4615 RepID=A0A6P5EIZ4_ANACO|nr:serine carboxypeptidase II-2-like [Ananas comosus]